VSITIFNPEFTCVYLTCVWVLSSIFLFSLVNMINIRFFLVCSFWWKSF